MSEQNVPPHGSQRYDFFLILDGMTCRSCEVMIERKLKKVSGIESVHGDSHKGLVRVKYVGREPAVEMFRNALASDRKYAVKGFLSHKKLENYLRSRGSRTQKRPTFGRIMGIFALAFLAAGLFVKLGLIKSGVEIGSSIEFGAAFVIGLIAAISSCIAVIGGLLISSVVQYQKECGEGNSWSTRMVPVGLFVAGRVISYTIFGGIIGWLGSAFTMPPIVTGGLVVVAALYMLVMGLDMLQIAPPSFKRLLPGMPKSLSHRLMDMGLGRASWITPFFTGAVTFFIPCGFTQALQLYALTSGSFASGAMVLGAFALGTVPALSLLGLSLNAFKGSARTFFFHFAGALVIIMGIVNIQNGFAISGHPLSFSPVASFFARTTTYDTSAAVAPSSVQATVKDGKQEIRMVAEGGYSPNDFTVKAGIPVEWIIDASQALGCERAFQVPGLRIRQVLDVGINTIEFTAQPGTYSFSCSMGMYRGTLRVN